MEDAKKKLLEQNQNIIFEKPNLWTRRELLQLGVIPLAARLLIPSSLSILNQILNPKNAFAQNTPTPCPFITINLSGGAATHGNVIPMNEKGGLLATYKNIGMGSTTGTNGVEASRVDFLGLPFHKNSYLLKGLKDGLMKSTSLDKMRGVSFCTSVQPDTNALVPLRHPFEVAATIENGGRKGTLFSDLQFFNVDSEIQSQISIKPFKDLEPSSRLSIKLLSEIQNSLNLTSVFNEQVNKIDRFSNGQKKSLSSLIEKIGHSQLKNNKPELKKMYTEAKNLISSDVSGKDLVDPAKNANVISAFNLDSKSNPLVNYSNLSADNNNAIATTVYCALKGYSSHSMLMLGGYDYHNPSRFSSDKKDYEAGLVIGRTLRLAELMNQPVFISVVTDGGCSSEESNNYGQFWKGDTSSTLQLCFSYHPNGIITNGSQVGYYLDDQTTETKTVIGGRADYITAAILANYLSMNGMIDQYSKYAPSTITSDRLAEVIRIKNVG